MVAGSRRSRVRSPRSRSVASGSADRELAVAFEAVSRKAGLVATISGIVAPGSS